MPTRSWFGRAAQLTSEDASQVAHVFGTLEERKRDCNQKTFAVAGLHHLATRFELIELLFLLLQLMRQRNSLAYEVRKRGV